MTTIRDCEIVAGGCHPWEHEWRGIANTNGPSDLRCARCGARSTRDPHILRSSGEAARRRAIAAALIEEQQP